MGFEKGHKKSNGRPKGSANKTTLLGRDIIEEYFIEKDGLKNLLIEIQGMDSERDRVNAKIKLLEFFIPKQKEIQTNAFDNLRFEILIILYLLIISRLIANSKRNKAI